MQEKYVSFIVRHLWYFLPVSYVLDSNSTEIHFAFHPFKANEFQLSTGWQWGGDGGRDGGGVSMKSINTLPLKLLTLYQTLKSSLLLLLLLRW